MKTLKDLKSLIKSTALSIKADKSRWKHSSSEVHDTVDKLRSHWELWSSLQEERRSFRHHLIAYCEMRGLARDKVEKPAENNMPSQEAIDAVKATYLPVWHHEDVHSCAQ